MQLKTTDAWTHRHRLYQYTTDCATHELHCMRGKNESPQTLPRAPVLFNYAERTKYLLSLWCCPGGCWQVAYELIWENKGTFFSYCGSLDPGLHRNTTIFKLPHSHDHHVHQLINFNTIFIEDIIAFFPVPSPLFNQQIKNINHFYLYLTLSWNRITGQMRERQPSFTDGLL